MRLCLSALTTDPLCSSQNTKTVLDVEKWGDLLVWGPKVHFSPQTTNTKIYKDQRLKRIALDCELDHGNLLLKNPANNLLHFQNPTHNITQHLVISHTSLADNPSHKNCNTQNDYYYFYAPSWYKQVPNEIRNVSSDLCPVPHWITQGSAGINQTILQTLAGLTLTTTHTAI